MYILGISGFGHDSAVALIKDGEVICAIEEERLSRQKYVWAFPFKSILFVLKQAQIDFEDIDYITFYFNTGKYNLSAIYHACKDMWRYPQLIPEIVWYLLVRSIIAGYMRIPFPNTIKLITRGRCLPKIKYIEHHLAHLGSAHLCSPFEESAVCVIDGIGELPVTSLYYCTGGKIKTLRKIYYPNSLGAVYAALTEYLGFYPASDEYKVMGLSAYGEANQRYERFFKDFIVLQSDGNYVINPLYTHFFTFGITKPLLSVEAYKILGPPRTSSKEITQRHCDIAFSLQKRIEEAIFHVLRYLYKKSQCKKLSAAGGVMLNCVANGKILEQTEFREIFIQPAASDSGASLGSALYFYHYVLRNERKYIMRHAYLGPDYSNEQIKDELQKSKLRYKYIDDPAQVGAQLLAEGKIIGWFQGRMEFGPRALGNRSILADPRNENMKDKVNFAVKFREPFRPFAPSILKEYVSEYFETINTSPYMLFAVRAQLNKRGQIPAVIHVDGTSRIHTVERAYNPLYYALLTEFYKLTGVPIILNTSFNIKGEPIVCTPSDALRCFCGTGLDALIIGNYLLIKEPP